MTTAAPVHWIAPHFAAISEFAGHSDDCGPCAHEVCVAAIEGRAPTQANMNAMRQADIDAGRWIFDNGVSHGQSVQQLFASAQALTPHIKAELFPATVDYTTPDIEAIHQRLKTALLRGSVCVLNIGKAGNLQGNEHGVQWHFVACGGIDSVQGYLIANGDRTPAGGPDWIPWPNIASAVPVALVEFFAPPPPQPLLPNGVTDQNGVLTFPGGYTMAEGFRDLWLAHQADLGLALMPALDTRDGGSIQVCEHAALRWDGKAVSVIDNTATLVSWLSKWAQLALVNDDLQARIGREQHDLTAAQGQLSTAQANVTSLKGTIASLVQNAQDIIKIAGAA